MNKIKNRLFSALFHIILTRLPKCKRICRFENEKVGVVGLVCHRDVDFFIYSIITFFYQIGINLPLYIVNDGSLTEKDIIKIRYYLNNLIIEDIDEEVIKIRNILSKYNYIYKYRFNNDSTYHKFKIDACLLNPFEKFIYLDSDVIFFQKPEEIIRWIMQDINTNLYTIHEDLVFSGSFNHEISFRKLLYKHLSIIMNPTFNSGLMCISNKSFINLPKMDFLFKLYYSLSAENSYYAEESIFSILFGMNKTAKSLPVSKYLNSPFKWVFYRYFNPETKMVHFSNRGETVNLFFKNAIRLAISHHFYW